MKKILIIDTRAGNLFSLQAAINRLGFETKTLLKPNEEDFDGIVVPGQGRFGTVMKNIREHGWEKYLTQARDRNCPMLGICVGMQIFFESSEEDPGTSGLAWFKGKAQALNFPKKPMVGWSRLNSQIWTAQAVYFVNSYAVKSSQYCIATTNYGENFCAAIRKGSFTGVQFHPEKSGQTGAQIIQQSLTDNENSLDD